LAYVKVKKESKNAAVSKFDTPGSTDQLEWMAGFVVTLFFSCYLFRGNKYSSYLKLLSIRMFELAVDVQVVVCLLCLRVLGLVPSMTCVDVIYMDPGITPPLPKRDTRGKHEVYVEDADRCLKRLIYVHQTDSIAGDPIFLDPS
jgi:hypothetical protein